MTPALPSRVTFARILIGCTNKKHAAKYAREMNAAGFVAILQETSSGRGANVLVKGARFHVETLQAFRVTLIPRGASR